MYNRKIKEELRAQAEEKYREFNSSLTPGCGEMYGVRLPKLRDMAKKLAKADWRNYLENASDDSFEEVMLQGLTIAYLKEELQVILPYIRSFVPKINNWAVCDSFCNTLKIAKTHQDEIWDFLEEYRGSGEEFELRFMLVMYLNFFLHEPKDKTKQNKYLPQVLQNIESVRHEGYYVKMAAAWALAEAYVYAADEVRAVLERGNMDDFTHNKAIQKMRESYRITVEEKEMLKKLSKSRTEKQI